MLVIIYSNVFKLLTLSHPQKNVLPAVKLHRETKQALSVEYNGFRIKI